MRIVAGAARGARLASVQGQGTRHSLARVKEAMFSALHHWLPGTTVLDLFAGSGQLGLEAVSRGAKNCVFIEQEAKAVAVIRQNATSTKLLAQCHIVHGDAMAFLRRSTQKFDLVLIDPPYGQNTLPGILFLLENVLAPGAIVVCESGTDILYPGQVAGLHLEKQARYAAVCVSRYRQQGLP